MNTIYFTLVGTNHYYGHEFMEKDMKVRLVKEHENEADKEAIRVELPGLGKVGYVSNSTWSVIGESWSAGRIYDKIGDTATGAILYKLPKFVLCTLDEDSLLENEIIEEIVE